MKHLKFTLLIGLLSILIAPTLVAQNIDANRMNRDIRIMENILSEIFRTRVETATAEGIYFSNVQMRNRGIRGTYLDGYGLIFMVANESDSRRPRLQVTGQSGYSFYYSTDDEQPNFEIDESSIRERITEFLVDYGSTIGQLNDDDNIMVIYGANSQSNSVYWNYRVAVVNGEVVSNNDDESEPLPVISGSVQFKNLKDYRSGRLDGNQVKQRVMFATSEGKEYMDLKVMGNIFETALDQGRDNSFRLSGGVNYMMLDNFGAIFNLDARYSSGRSGLFGRLSETRRVLRVAQEQQARSPQRAENLEDEIEALEAQEEKIRENMLEAYQDLKTGIAEYLVDYGRTLNSVDSDQHILTSVDISSGGEEEIPERVDFQIKKSILEDLDRGRISREDAISAVSITEY